jgi:hypothetical protein
MDKTRDTQQEIVNLYVKLAKKGKNHPSLGDLKKEGVTPGKIKHWFNNLSSLKSYVYKCFPSLDDVIGPENTLRDKLVKSYIELANKNKTFPSRSELLKWGVTKDRVRHHFGSLSDLKEFVQKNHASEIKNVFDERSFIKRNTKTLDSKLTKYERFVITSIVGGGVAHKEFYESLKVYCEENKAKLLIQVCEDPASINKFTVTEDLRGEQFIFNDVQLNSNLFLSSIKLSAKHIDPITGLSRIGQENGSFIYASPKQRLHYTPIRNNKMPHALMTTGAITLPDYATERYMSERTAYLAKADHVIGALVVEIQDDDLFHFRQLQADNRGGFADLNKYYTPKDIEDIRPVELVFGDWHSRRTNEVVKQAVKHLVNFLKPEGIVLHDSFDGQSINHWIDDDTITRAILYLENKLSLEEELKFFTNDIEELATWAKRLTIVKSNHDVFLDRFLRKGKYTRDPINLPISAKLAGAMIQKQDPLKYAAEVLFGLQAKNVRWLAIDEDYEVAKIQLGAHGHKGPNGSRGSLKNMEVAYGNCVSGHDHTGGILRQSWKVGTLSDLRLGYNEGASSWVHSVCSVYGNGNRQLINFIDGTYRLE